MTFPIMVLTYNLISFKISGTPILVFRFFYFCKSLDFKEKVKQNLDGYITDKMLILLKALSFTSSIKYKKSK